ncbi:Yip1 domain-containing protein [Spironucleus salmonicida]|uniref:Protein YIPF n=1 Tax=Spironucleus salmonicida TaxID=348837 RepID=A0A9P8LXJ1_9EUKA|nr:Yip1 domain-containing protein [Spironucleus salmonicida]
MADFDPNNPNQQVSETLYQQPPAFVQNVINDNLPQGCTKVFKLAFWQQYFQLTQLDIFQRVLSALVIFKGDFLTTAALAEPDLFMPFWIPVTLVFIAFFAQVVLMVIKSGTSISNSIGIFSGIVAGYVYVITLILWGIVWCMDMKIDYTVCMQLAAYSLIVLIPTCALIPLVGFLPIYILPIIFTLGAIWSTIFISRNVIKYGQQQSSDKGKKIGFIVGFIGVHCCIMVALGCVLFVVK